MPALASVEGRLDDVVITPDGRRVGRLDPVFKSDLGVVEAQIIQTSRQTLCVRFVPASGYAKTKDQGLVNALRERVGDMDIALEPVDHIERGPNGKFRAVVSRL
jgi:phenylacetate-CoA ligase